jgi:hypothetical protein
MTTKIDVDPVGFQMTTINDGSIAMIVDEPVCLPSLFKCRYHYPESSGYSSKEADCSSPEHRVYHANRCSGRKLRVSSAIIKPEDYNHRPTRTSMLTTSMSNMNSLTIDESPSQTKSARCTVRNETLVY